MTMRNYWRESVACALEATGLQFTDEQLAEVTDSIIVSIENEGAISGRDAIPNPLQAEVDRLRGLRIQDQVAHDQQIAAERLSASNAAHSLRCRIWDLQDQLRKAGAA